MSRAEWRDEGVRMEFIAGLRLLVLMDYFGHAPQGYQSSGCDSLQRTKRAHRVRAEAAS